MSTAPYVLGAIAAVGIVKVFFRPHRAVVKVGTLGACPGPARGVKCDPSLAIVTEPGTPVYSTVSGRVAAVGPRFIQVASLSEPVVLMYDGVTPGVANPWDRTTRSQFVEGQYVGRGQALGESRGTVFFSVTEWLPGGELQKIDPASWLASRGQRIAAKNTGKGSSWCEQGRHIEVPAEVGRPCNLHEPDRGAFALLPVTVTVNR
jgi:hypothetical protein